ncbi:MFS family permease [Nocardioides marinisabuli]|uniref:MFS family permease n=1 Tax=Nocardioides marinisabuli TaxID=419476 RepID=A0A7Y9EXZ9_9ACTN|nr:MFS transporter [Nocardioides marinisabuli]NYD55856.1 MFS family permease [Nocardioides marinisabuli]
MTTVENDTSALADPTYRRFLAARTIAMAGNALTLVALPVLVYRLTGSAALTAAVAAVETAPYLVLGLPAGALVDRWNRRRVLVLASAGSGLAMLTVPAADLLGVLSFTQLVVVAATISSLFVFADAASFGMVPQMVGRHRVASATSSLVTVGTAIGLVGPLVSGVLVTVTSPALVLGIDGLAYLGAAALTARLRWPGSDDVRPTAPDRRLRAEVAEGLRYIWAMPVVRWLTVLGTGASLAGGAVTGLLVVLGVEQLGLASDSPRLGWLFAAGAVGTFLASLALPRLQRLVGVGLLTTSGYALALVSVLALSLTSTLLVALPLLLVLNLAMTALIVNGIVVRQVVTPDHLQSRVNTTARLIAWGGSPLGAALGGVVAGAASTEWALRAASLGLAASLVGALVVGVPRFPRLAALEQDPTIHV